MGSNRVDAAVEGFLARRSLQAGERGDIRGVGPTELGWATSHLAASSVVTPHPHLRLTKIGKQQRAVLRGQGAITQSTAMFTSRKCPLLD